MYRLRQSCPVCAPIRRFTPGTIVPATKRHKIASRGKLVREGVVNGKKKKREERKKKTRNASSHEEIAARNSSIRLEGVLSLSSTDFRHRRNPRCNFLMLSNVRRGGNPKQAEESNKRDPGVLSLRLGQAVKLRLTNQHFPVTL